MNIEHDKGLEPLRRIMRFVTTAGEKFSTCARRQIGCILIDNTNSIIACGHNHSSEKNTVNCRLEPCPGASLPRGEHTTAQGICKADIHAEIHALSKKPLGHKGFFGAVVNCPPCKDCVKELALAGCKFIIVPKEALDRDDSKSFCKKNYIAWREI